VTRRSGRRWATLIVAVALSHAVAAAGSPPPEDRFASRLTDEVRRLSFTGHKGALYAVRSDGGRADVAGAAELAHLKALTGAVLLVHGSQYDPSRVGLPNPYSTFAHVVRTHLDSNLTGVSFGWYSAPWSIRNQFAAFFRGSFSVYALARRNLDPQVQPLAALIRALPPEWSAVCHSVGCELIRRALDSDPLLPRPRRVLLLSGDLREALFDRFAATSGIEVLAVRSKSDRPLGRSAFRKESQPFWAGKAQRTSAWTDLMFYPESLEKGGRWSLRYRHRRRFWDHMATFEFDQPWNVYNGFLRNGLPVSASPSTCLRPLATTRG
jgi:hypothetical protein